MMSAKISVVLASYNGSQYIAEQINSVLPQLSFHDELIISDDQSTDETASVIQSFKDQRIKFIQNNGKKGVAGNFENGLKAASGDYIFLSDQDDVWFENKVEKVLEKLENSSCVLHNATLIDADGNITDQNLFGIYGTRQGFWQNLTRNTFVGCCMAFRKEILDYALPFPEKITMHDMWIALISEKRANTALINEPLMFYRRHDKNASTTSQKSRFTLAYQLKYRTQMLMCLLGK